jgi:predicted acetyltransferase
MSIEVRNPARPEDYAAAIDVMSTGFLERPDVAKVAAQIQGHWRPERTWIAWDGPRACGNFRSWPTELTIPGGSTLAAAAVSAVGVLPTHRRRGILTQMADAAHRAIRDAGEPLSILLASEYPIYGRYGYGPATRDATITVHTKETGMPGEMAGTLELAPLTPETRDALRAVFEVSRLRTPGEIWRRDITWDIDLGIVGDTFEDKPWRGFVVLHRGAGGDVDGYVRYKTDPKWDAGPTGEIQVEDLHALNDEAYADIWRYLLSIDLATKIVASNRPVSDPLPWLLSNPRAAGIGRLNDRLWVRIWDVPRALATRAYERAGALTLEIVDDEAWGGARRWRLEAGPDGATCRQTDAAPDLTLPIRAVGSVYLGGSRLRDVVRATGVDEHRAGALAEADALFRTAEEPWLSTFF